MPKGWTLFLDRDGVINQKPAEHDYIKSWDEFVFLPNVIEAMKILANKFDRIIIISNQQGVGKGVMTQKALDTITFHMYDLIVEAGGRIDSVLYCTRLEEENHPDRKPGIGMALRAQLMFKDINFQKSWVVGDSLDDMEFGRRIGAQTFMVGKKRTLYDFAKRI